MKIFKVYLKGRTKALRIEGDSAQEVKALGSLIIRRERQPIAQFRLTEISGWNEEAAEKSESQQNAVRSKKTTIKKRSPTTKTRKTAKNSEKSTHAASMHTPSIGETRYSGGFPVHPRTPFPPLAKKPDTKPKS